MATRRQGRMAKTQTVPVRLDPVLKWAAELAAGKERRSLNSFIEWAVEQAVKRVAATQVISTDDRMANISAWDVANECWNVLPMLRLKVLAERYPGALTVKERAIFQAYSLLSSKKYDDKWLCRDTRVWELLEKFGAEEISLDELHVAMNKYFTQVNFENESQQQVSDYMAAQRALDADFMAAQRAPHETHTP